jgi:hypothetical protein
MLPRAKDLDRWNPGLHDAVQPGDRQPVIDE